MINIDSNIIQHEFLFAKGALIIHKLVVKEEYRNQGHGTNFMNTICEIADVNKSIILLTPSKSYGGSVRRLNKFYRSFGFVKRKGYFELPLASMIRLPKK